MSTPPGQDQLNWWPERGGVPVTVTNVNGGAGQLCTGIGLITSITAANFSTTTAARFTLLDGTDTTGPPLAAIGTPAGGGASIGAGDGGIYFGTGLYLRSITGAAQIVVTYIPLTLPLK